MEQFEDHYNLLEKRVHITNPLAISLEFLGFVIYSPREAGLTHKYPCWSISFVDGNEGVFHFGEKELKLQEGSFVLIPPYAQHYLVCPGPKDMRLIYYGFTYDLPCTGIDVFELNKILAEIPEFKLYSQALGEMTLMLSSNRSRESVVSCSPRILEYTIKVCRSLTACCVPKTRRTLSEKHYRMIEDVKRILNQHLGENITIRDVAKELCLSPRYLADLFVKATGMGFVAYYKMIRMERACSLLYSTDLSISEIADALGYCDIHYFSRKFKEYFGSSPTAVRNSHGNRQFM